MRILVCGGRDYINERKVFAILCEYKDIVTVIIHGAQRGADLIAQDWAIINHITDLPFPVTKADWERFGKPAGHMRNKKMLEQGRPDLVIAFPGGPGTANMIAQAEKAHVTIRRIEEEENHV